MTWRKGSNNTILYQGVAYSIVNIQRQAAGDYRCTAWNGMAEKANATATVTVHCELDISLLKGALLYDLSKMNSRFKIGGRNTSKLK